MGIFTCVQCSIAARKPLILISRENNQHGFIIYTITNLRLQLLINDKNNLVKAIFCLPTCIYFTRQYSNIEAAGIFLSANINFKITFVFSFGNSTINNSVLYHYIHYLFGCCNQKKNVVTTFLSLEFILSFTTSTCPKFMTEQHHLLSSRSDSVWEQYQGRKNKAI